MIKLKPYQIQGARQIHKWKGRALLADDMGLGKTVQCLYYLKKTKSFPVIVVCPASLKENWKHEAAMHFGMRAEVLSGREPPPNWGRFAPPNFVIINYDILEQWIPHLLKLKPKLVIIDEAQGIKNEETQAFENCRVLTKPVKKLILATGTPVENRPKELWALLHLLYPKAFKKPRPFYHEFCQAKRKPWGWDFRGAKNLDKLHDILINGTDMVPHGIMIRRLKQDVLGHVLKKKKRIMVPMELSDWDQYRFAEEELLAWLAETKGARAAIKAAPAEHLVKWQYLRHLTAQLKIPMVEAYLDRFLATTNKKMTVFGIHHDILIPLYQKYQRHSVIVNGKVSQRKKDLSVRRFQTDRRCRLFFGNIKSAGTGLTLTAANLSAVIELGWTPGEMKQLEDRIDRIGQTKVPKIFYLLARGTVEERMASILYEKQKVCDAILEGNAEANEYSLLDLVEEDMLSEWQARKEEEEEKTGPRGRFHIRARELKRKKRLQAKS